MSKDFAWQLFKNTGNIDAFMIMRDMEIANEITPKVKGTGVVENGDNQNQGDSNQSSQF